MRNIDPSLIALLNEVRKAYESIPERFKNEDASILTRVVARLVSGLVVQDGQLYGETKHSWLAFKAHIITVDQFLAEGPAGVDYVIDLCPRHIHPGPVIVELDESFYLEWYKEDKLKMNKKDEERIAEIVDATETARRFLGMP